MNRQLVALAAAAVGAVLLVTGLTMLCGPVALVACGAALIGVGMFVIDVDEPRVKRRAKS